MWLNFGFESDRSADSPAIAEHVFVAPASCERFLPGGVAQKRGKMPALRLPICGWLDYDGFLIFAEGAAKGVGDFSYCRERFDGSEDSGHEIFGASGAPFDFG